MQVENVSTMQNMVPPYQVGASGDNEAAERIPDNEQAEMAMQNPSTSSNSESYSLAPWQGNSVDMMA